MIYYRRPSGLEPAEPQWLAGFQSRPGAFLRRYDTQSGTIHAIEPWQDPMGVPNGMRWHTIQGGWEIAWDSLSQSDIMAHHRLSGCFVSERDIADYDGRVWALPLVADRNGTRRFLPPLCGPDYTPTPLEWQERGEQSARECRGFFEAMASGAEIPTPAMARWISQALECQYHIPRDIFQVIPVFDHGFLVAAVAVLAGREDEL